MTTNELYLALLVLAAFAHAACLFVIVQRAQERGR